MVGVRRFALQSPQSRIHLTKSTSSDLSLSSNTSLDNINIKILNAGAWARSREKTKVSLPRELEEIIPEVEDFYKKQHSGRKLTWVHSWSTGTVSTALRRSVFVSHENLDNVCQ